MAEDQIDIDDLLSDGPKKKKDSIMPFLAALGLISIVAVGAGWIVADKLSAPASTDEAQIAKTTPASEGAADKGDKPASNYIDGGKAKILKLEPVLVTMAESDNAFLRMELALVFDQETTLATEENRLRIGSEIAAFARNLSLKDISGPSGYLHLRDDLLDRARLATSGEVKELLILSLVSE